MFQKKMSESARCVAQERELIANNAAAADGLLMLTDDAALKQKLSALKEKIKYLQPVESVTALQRDNAIRDKLATLKNVLVHAKADAGDQADGVIKEIYALILERNN